MTDTEIIEELASTVCKQAEMILELRNELRQYEALFMEMKGNSDE